MLKDYRILSIKTRKDYIPNNVLELVFVFLSVFVYVPRKGIARPSVEDTKCGYSLIIVIAPGSLP